LAKSSIPVVTLGIGCSVKPDASDPCVPIPGSNRSAINQVGIRAYERGAALKRHCEAKLAAAQAKINQITVGPDGKISLSPFETEKPA
jgi:Exonuclease VII small subunit